MLSPAYLSYSPPSIVREPGRLDATREPALVTAIRPPPGLEHLDASASPLHLPSPEPLGPLEAFGSLDAYLKESSNIPSIPPPQFEAPRLELKETPPAPHQEPCLRLALLQYLPNTEPIPIHDKTSCRPCAFFHTKGCVSARSGSHFGYEFLHNSRGQNGTQCEFCHICPPGEKKRRQKLRRKVGVRMCCDCASLDSIQASTQAGRICLPSLYTFYMAICSKCITLHKPLSHKVKLLVPVTVDSESQKPRIPCEGWQDQDVNRGLPPPQKSSAKSPLSL